MGRSRSSSTTQRARRSTRAELPATTHSARDALDRASLAADDMRRSLPAIRESLDQLRELARMLEEQPESVVLWAAPACRRNRDDRRCQVSRTVSRRGRRRHRDGLRAAAAHASPRPHDRAATGRAGARGPVAATPMLVRLLETHGARPIGRRLLHQQPDGELTEDPVWHWSSAPDRYFDTALPA